MKGLTNWQASASRSQISVSLRLTSSQEWPPQTRMLLSSMLTPQNTPFTDTVLQLILSHSGMSHSIFTTG
jgi:hypothetical protein